MVLFLRQRQLLALLDAVGGRLQNLDFQKLLFLFCAESESTPPYDFVPYRFGAFSFTSYADRRKLAERNFVSPSDKAWEITVVGRKQARSDSQLQNSAEAFAAKYQGLRGNRLIVETYKQYPYFAIRSEIAHKLLRNDPAALEAITQQQQRITAFCIATIGYEAKTLEGYLNTLLKAGISILCDVRRNPISRKYGFSKSNLAQCCLNLGIRYEHLPELGIASDYRQELNTQADYDDLFAVYVLTMLPKQGEALQKIENWVLQGNRVALTCYEHNPNQCHRHCVADALSKRLGSGFSPVHL